MLVVCAETVLLSMVQAPTRTILVSVAETMLWSMARVDTKGQVDVLGPCCHHVEVHDSSFC